MKAIILTIRLKYFYLTYKGIKTVEIRKSAPKDFVGDVYEVVSKTNFEKDLMEIPENERKFFKKFVGKVGLKFALNKVEEIKVNKNFSKMEEHSKELIGKANISLFRCCDYLNFKNGYAWHIDNLEIFDRPKELSKFCSTLKEKVKTDCPLNCKGWCITNYNCKYYVEDDCWGGQLACACPTKEVNIKKPLKKSPQSWCYIEI